MITDKYADLLLTYEMSFAEITQILKVIGNGKRLKILVFLLNKPQSYSSIVKELQLKKTAISNHLSHLLNVNLIKRGEYGIYEITGDGIEFLKGIEQAYHMSPTRQLRKFEELQRRGVSESFLHRFSQ